jgi:proteic killer suppression protein
VRRDSVFVQLQPIVPERASHQVPSGGNDTRCINSDHEDKVRDQLAALDSATDIADMELPGWRLHPLKGRDKGRHAIWVSGNWRMTFEFEDGDAYVVDYEDYH